MVEISRNNAPFDMNARSMKWIDFESVSNLASPFKNSPRKRHSYMIEDEDKVEIQIDVGCSREDLGARIENGCLHVYRVNKSKNNNNNSAIQDTFNDALFALPKDCCNKEIQWSTRDNGIFITLSKH
jgi:hypothetical protein